MTSFSVLSRRGGGSSSRIVLITGVSKGLGRALALEMAKRGHTVIGCSRSDDKLIALQSELPDSRHLFVSVDVVSIRLYVSPPFILPPLAWLLLGFLELHPF